MGSELGCVSCGFVLLEDDEVLDVTGLSYCFQISQEVYRAEWTREKNKGEIVRKVQGLRVLRVTISKEQSHMGSS